MLTTGRYIQRVHALGDPIGKGKGKGKAKVKVKVKHFHYRPGQALRSPGD
jgi:hypothetical protein